MTYRSTVIALATMCSLSTPLFAQTESRPEMVTDRPDYTESSEVVGAGLFQLEAGFNYEGADGVRSLTVPGALLRLGLGSRLELRLGSDGFLSQSAGPLRVSGAADVEVGVKLRLLNQATRGIDFAIIPMASLPTGSETATSGGVDPTLKLTWARSLGRAFDLTGNVNFASVSDGDGRFFQQAFSLSLGHDLRAGWGGFLETYAFAPMDRGTGTGLTVDAGVTRPIGANLQLDFEAGRGVTADAPDWFAGVGFAVRGRARGDRR